MSLLGICCFDSFLLSGISNRFLLVKLKKPLVAIELVILVIKIDTSYLAIHVKTVCHTVTVDQD